MIVRVRVSSANRYTTTPLRTLDLRTPWEDYSAHTPPFGHDPLWFRTTFSFVCEVAEDGGVLFDADALSRYILCCCQDVKGGLRDKPTKCVDVWVCA